MGWLKAFLVDLIATIFAKFLKKETQEMEVGHSDGDTEERLHDKIDKTWSKSSDP